LCYLHSPSKQQCAVHAAGLDIGSHGQHLTFSPGSTCLL
jgi:hypothetical protein